MKGVKNIRKKWYETNLGAIKSSLKDVSNVLRILELRSFITQERNSWSAPKSLGNDDIIACFESLGLLKKVEVPDRYGSTLKNLYVQRSPSAFQVALGLRPNSYLSHASAAQINNLSRNIHKVIYVTKEQSEKAPVEIELAQESIDQAFKKPQRVTHDQYVYEDMTLMLLSGKFTGDLGVGAVTSGGDEMRVTRLERTLIDMTVRPDYSGGVYQVLEAYERAVDQLSVAAFMSLLKRIAFIYPYHQAIGFYMEKAGFPEATCDRMRSYGLGFDFYLAHAMKEVEYDEKWRLYVPVGMEIAR